MGLFGGKKSKSARSSRRPARQAAPKKRAAQKESPEAESADSGTRICFLLLADESPLDEALVEAATRKEFGTSAQVNAKDDDDADAEDDGEGGATTHFISAPGLDMTFISHMPAPIPDGEAENAADANIFFPNGSEIVAQHKSHCVIAVMSGPNDPVESCIAVTRLARVALQAAGDRAIGIYWGNGSIVQSAEVFGELSQQVSVENLPLHLWMRFQLFNDESSSGVGMYTVGMGQFGLMEIEIPLVDYDAEALFEFVFNTASYLIGSGPVINDGDTVGGSETEHIKVYHKPSMFEGMGTVYQIHMRAR